MSGHEASGMVGTLVVTTTAGGGGGSPGGGGNPTSTDGLTIFRGNRGGCHTLAAAGSTGRVGRNLDDEIPDFDKVYEQVTEATRRCPRSSASSRTLR